MEWLFWGILLVIVVGVVIGGKSSVEQDKIVSAGTRGANDKDDFAGNGVGAYFLMEEFVDKPGAGREESELQQSELPADEEEAGWFEDEF